MEVISSDQISHLCSPRRLGLPRNKLLDLCNEITVRQAAAFTVGACHFACVLGSVLHAGLKSLIHLLFDALFI
jgi:hypothetical protein